MIGKDGDLLRLATTVDVSGVSSSGMFLYVLGDRGYCFPVLCLVILQ